MAKKDITGMRFGRWTAIAPDKCDRHGIRMWLCECDCGNTGTIRINSLLSGGSTSCGCYVSELNSKRAGTYLEINGESHSLSGWARVKGVSYNALMKRIERGEDPAAALQALVEKAVKRNV